MSQIPDYAARRRYDKIHTEIAALVATLPPEERIHWTVNPASAAPATSLIVVERRHTCGGECSDGRPDCSCRTDVYIGTSAAAARAAVTAWRAGQCVGPWGAGRPRGFWSASVRGERHDFRDNGADVDSGVLSVLS